MNKTPKNPRVDMGLVVPAVVCAVCLLLALLLLALLVFREEGDVQEAPPAAESETVLKTEALDRRPLVVLDAGHGGDDPGAVSRDGAVSEYEVNQALVDRVLALLARHEVEIAAVQAQPPGQTATPMDRANTAAHLQADLLVSLHLNADESPYTRGFQVFPAPPGRLHHKESVRFARLLAGRVGEATEVPVLGADGIYYAYYRKIPGGYTKYLVEASQVDEDTPRMDESFGVVEYPGCPAVLAEMWHISNAQDMALCHSEEGMAQMAQCVYEAICAYFSLVPKAGA